MTAFICHVGYQVTADVARRLADGVDPVVITTAEAVAGSVPGVIHAHARARWTGRTLRVEIEGWVDPDLPRRDADALGRQVASSLARQLPEASSLTWTVRAGPVAELDHMSEPDPARTPAEHSHEHQHGHEHEHGGGRMAGLRHRVGHVLVPHSHDAGDKVDAAMEASREGMRTLWISLVTLGVTAAVQAVIVVLSGSVALLGDTIHNAADALTAVPLGRARS